MMPVCDESVGPPHAVHVPAGEGWAGAGSGWSVHGTVLDARLEERMETVDAARLPEARDMLAPARVAFEAGLALAPEDAAPVYLRSNVARASPRRIA